MLPIDPGDGQGSVTPARPVEDIVPLRDRVPAQAMSRGGTIIRPGAVAWGGMRDSTDSGYSSCESIERILASVAADPGQLPALLIELSTTRLWVPLPVRHRPFTDGAAVRLPLIEAEGEDFVPCFTSVQRLTAWVDAADSPSRRARRRSPSSPRACGAGSGRATPGRCRTSWSPPPASPGGCPPGSASPSTPTARTAFPSTRSPSATWPG